MRIYAIGSTVADVLMQCGGTIARYLRDGSYVTIASCCPESIGNRDSETRLGDHEVFGSVRIEHYNMQDLADTSSARDQIMDGIRGADAEVLLSPSPRSPDQTERQIARLVFNAAYAACVPNYTSPGGVPVTSTRAPILHMDHLGAFGVTTPEYVDISEVWGVKVQALELTSSSPEKSVANAEVVNRARGIQVQREFAEVFTPELVWGRLGAVRFLP